MKRLREANQAPIDREDDHEPDIESAWATSGWDQSPDALKSAVELTTPRVAPAWGPELNVDQTDRMIFKPVRSHGGRAIRLGLILIVLAAPLGLARMGGTDWYRVLDPFAASSSLPEPKLDSPTHSLDRNATSSSQHGPKLDSSAHTLDSNPGDDRQIDGAAGRAPEEADRKPIAREAETDRHVEKADTPEVASPATSTQQETVPTSKDLQAALQSATATRATTEEPQARVKRTPTPETRPTTLPGWTLREVIGDTVVLQGPDGIRRARQGDTVPGVGKVYSVVRWGNHLLVATSKGLIGTR